MHLRICLAFVGTVLLASGSAAQNIECTDVQADFEASKWIQPNAYLKYARDEADLPAPLNETMSAQGIFYFRGNPSVTTQSVRRPVEDTERFVYLRYYAHHVSNDMDSNYYVFPALNQPYGRRYLDSTPDFQWKEILITLDGTFPFPPFPASIGMASADTTPADFLLIDQIIYVYGPEASVPSIDAIKAFCEDQFNPTTSEAPTTTDPETESTTTEEATTIEEDTTTEEATTTQEPTTTTESTTPAPRPNPITEWIDVLADFQNSEWSRPSSLRYAATSDDLPELVGNLTGSGIFYFQGDSFLANQAVFRSAHSGQGGDAYLFLRYYVQHTNGPTDQNYYIFPALGKPLGVHYLDTNANQEWKEIFIQLDTAGFFPAEVGLATRDPENFLLIDRLVFIYRPAA